MRAVPVAIAAALLACATARPALAHPDRAAPYAVELVDEAGNSLPTFAHRGRTYVLGTLGERYLVRVRNRSGARTEVVVSVDGRDVIDGRPAAWDKRGYLVEARGEITIDGYRLSESSVAAFRFGSVPRSYASRMGDARDVGVIGVAVFPERRTYSGPLPVPAPAPRRGGQPSDAAPGRAGEAESGPAPSSAPRGEGLADERRADRRGLGTEFAEEHDSPVVQVSFERASSRPDAVLTVRYDDRQGLAALGIDGCRRMTRDERWLRETAEPFRASAFAEPPAGWRR
jgi:hypothetical protein